MKYKLLAVDVDGTLVRRDGSIHPDDSEAIERLKQSGVPVTIVTGRLYSGTRSTAAMIRVDGPVACVDGSHIVDHRDGAALFYQGIVGDHATTVRDILGRRGAASFLFANDAIVHDSGGEPFAPYVRTWSPNIDVVASVHEHPYWEHERGVMAVVSVGTEEDILGASDELREQLAHAAFVVTFPVTRIRKFAMMVRAAGPTKGTAIEWLAKHHGCDVSEVVAVGDWLNDMPMFQVAGRSFAMKQAPPVVKELATDELEADGLVGGGIAEAIRKAWG